MSNPHLAQIHTLRQNARQFWAAWQQAEARLAQLDNIDFVEQANELLHQFCPECIVELEGVAPASGELPSLVFSANGIREHFPQVQALAELAQTQRYRVTAFRSPQGGSDAFNFGIEIDGFRLSVSDIAVALDEWGMLPALEIAFTRPIPDDMRDCAQNMAFIMLDHIVGEWAAAVKISMVDFVNEIAPERALSFTELPEKLNQMWQKLGYTGVYPEPEWQFGTYQIEENEEKRTRCLGADAQRIRRQPARTRRYGLGGVCRSAVGQQSRFGCRLRAARQRRSRSQLEPARHFRVKHYEYDGWHTLYVLQHQQSCWIGRKSVCAVRTMPLADYHKLPI